MTSITDQIIAAHGSYVLQTGGCSCGDALPMGHGSRAGHLRHVAEVTEREVRAQIASAIAAQAELCLATAVGYDGGRRAAYEVAGQIARGDA